MNPGLFFQQEEVYLTFGYVRMHFISTLVESLFPTISFISFHLILLLLFVRAVSSPCFLSILSILRTFSKYIHSLHHHTIWQKIVISFEILV